MGNLASVAKALARSGADARVTQSAAEVRGAEAVVLPGTVERLETGLKVPHIGWNDLEWGPAGAGMARGLPAPATVYFVHSYAAAPEDPSVVAATTDYGVHVVAAVARDNMWAVQFHLEKSSSVGLALLAGFVATIHREAGTS